VIQVIKVTSADTVMVMNVTVSCPEYNVRDGAWEQEVFPTLMKGWQRRSWSHI